MSDGRVWMIELKTERFSHRPEQLPTYVELARHHYPGQRIDLTYVTPPMTVPGLRSPEGVYAHVFWDDVLPLVQTTWRDAEGVAAEVREALCDALAGIRGPWKEWREETLADGLGHALALARLTQADGRQRALEHSAGSLEELKRLRIHVRDHVRGEPNPLAPDVTPWLWNQATTDGAPMTETGRTLGYELRLSRARSIAS